MSRRVLAVHTGHHPRSGAQVIQPLDCAQIHDNEGGAIDTMANAGRVDLFVTRSDESPFQVTDTPGGTIG